MENYTMASGMISSDGESGTRQPWYCPRQWWGSLRASLTFLRVCANTCFELCFCHIKELRMTIWILEGCQEHQALLNSIIFDKIEQNCFGTRWFSGRKLKLSFCLVWMLEKRQNFPPCPIIVHGHSPFSWHKKRGSMLLLFRIYHLDQIKALPLLRPKVWQLL